MGGLINWIVTAKKMDFEGIQTIFHIMPSILVGNWHDALCSGASVKRYYWTTTTGDRCNQLQYVAQCAFAQFAQCTSAHSQAALKQKYFARRIGQQMHFSNFRPHLINGSWKIYFFALDKPGWKVFDISLPGQIFYLPLHRFSRRDPCLFDLVIFNSAKQMFGDMFHHNLLLITQFVQ